MAGFVEAYRKAGYTLENRMNSWSAVKADDSAVALTVWKDELRGKDGQLYLELRGHPLLSDWQPRQGNLRRIRHVQHGLDKCGGIFDIILCEAVDLKASPRKVRDAWLWKGMKGRIDAETFDPNDGTYLLTFFRA
ncbi:hypothetical protein NX862_09495 [Rhodobacter sp. KR11]|uniref:hypothetical protein n=1 Tax=Rhodobacter sp. KR11 TaxID=2974588 RepID=UPI002223B110|nr:hypothetical protein [Rhodobacter sp. KR11]MCW1918989.1 hypothetical protein [Rhodobacter sp. KR11]